MSDTITDSASILIAAAEAPIGVQLGRISPVTAAALVFAGLLSVFIFPVVGLSLLREDDAALPTSLGETRPLEPSTALVPSHRPSA